MSHDDDGNLCQPHCMPFNHAVNLTVLSPSSGGRHFASVKETSRNLCHNAWTVFSNRLGILISNLPYLNNEPEFPFILLMMRVSSSLSLEYFSLNSARVENESERGQAFFLCRVFFQMVSGPLSRNHAMLLSVLGLTSTIIITVPPSFLQQMPAKMDESVLNGCPGLRNDRKEQREVTYAFLS